MMDHTAGESPGRETTDGALELWSVVPGHARESLSFRCGGLAFQAWLNGGEVSIHLEAPCCRRRVWRQGANDALFCYGCNAEAYPSYTSVTYGKYASLRSGSRTEHPLAGWWAAGGVNALTALAEVEIDEVFASWESFRALQVRVRGEAN